MSDIQLGFNAHNFQPQFSAGGGLPVGRHPVVIIADGTEAKATKAGDGGGYLALMLQAIDGSPAKGGKQVLRLNLWSQSEAAREIAHKQMSAICHAVGIFDVPVVSVLFNRPFMVDIQPQATNPQYTEIAAIYDMNGNVPGANSAAQQQAQQAPPQQGMPNGFGPQGSFNPPQQQGGFAQPDQGQQGGFQQPQQQGGFQAPGGGFQQPQQGGAPQQGGFQQPQQQNGGFQPPGRPQQGGFPQQQPGPQAGGFQAPAQGGWGPR